ncbi:hypothetical protein HK104_007286, partial [Borealophlyctis nickersoniae]
MGITELLFSPIGGDTLARPWASLLSSHSPDTIDIVGTFLVQLVAFWVPSLIYLLLDRFPHFRTYKIQSNAPYPTNAVLWSGAK